MFLTGGLVPAGAEVPRPAVHIGVLAYLGSEAAQSDWSHVTARLNAVLPKYRFSLKYYDMVGLREAVRQRQVDFVITNGGHYVVLEAELGISRIATLTSTESISPARAVGSAVIARADRHDLVSLSDLRGRRVAAVAPDAFGGYLVAARAMQHAGVDVDTDLARRDFLGFPMQQVVDAVVRGTVDAGVVRACLLEDMARDGVVRLADLKILSPQAVDGFSCGLSTDLYPDWPFATARHTDLTLAKSVATALLSMPPTAQGVAWTVPADYQVVHDLYRELRTGPYAYLRATTLQDLARRYWPFMLIGAMIMVGWVVHTVRVEHEVHVRTGELRQALEARDMAEARIRAHQEQADHLSRLSILGELSGTLAHELNQPLTTIGNYAQSLLRRLDTGRLSADALAEASREIAVQAERAGGIVHRIRAFARKRVAVRESQPLVNLVREAASLFSAMLVNAPAVDVDDRLPADAAVEADALQIQQVLLNLLKNAADALQGLPVSRRRIDVLLVRDETRYLVSVRDHGAGLPEALRAHLFESFFTTKADGMGLGLSICKTIVEAHGGRLWAESNNDGPGMTFLFTLPAHDPSA
jgi:two-component system sensor histidine kinase TtrS